MARIVHLCPRYLPAHGGAELVFTRLSEHFAALGHDVAVWTTDALTVRGLTAPGEPRVVPAEETIRGVRVRRHRTRRWYGQRFGRTLAHLVPAGPRWHANTLRWTPWMPTLDRRCATMTDPLDVVHAAGLPYSSLLRAGEELARRTGARWLVTPFTHVAAPGEAGRLMRRAYLSPFNLRLLAGADVVFALTDVEQTLLVEAGLDPARVRVLGLGVDADRVVGGGRDGQRRRWGVEPGAIVIGHLANKSADKGTLDLLAAMQDVWTRHPSARLVLAGPAMSSFTDHVRRHGLDARVIDLPGLDDTARRDFFAGIDVFALPSYVESFGLAALEAAAAGAAVVVYAHGGPSAIWTAGVDALLVPAGDRAALAAAIDRLCADTDERARLAAAGAAHARTFTWARVLALATEAYGLGAESAA